MKMAPMQLHKRNAFFESFQRTGLKIECGGLPSELMLQAKMQYSFSNN